MARWQRCCSFSLLYVLVSSCVLLDRFESRVLVFLCAWLSEFQSWMCTFRRRTDAKQPCHLQISESQPLHLSFSLSSRNLQCFSPAFNHIFPERTIALSLLLTNSVNPIQPHQPQTVSARTHRQVRHCPLEMGQD